MEEFARQAVFVADGGGIASQVANIGLNLSGRLSWDAAKSLHFLSFAMEHGHHVGTQTLEFALKHAMASTFAPPFAGGAGFRHGPSRRSDSRLSTS